jgi:hypothetical protein
MDHLTRRWRNRRGGNAGGGWSVTDLQRTRAMSHQLVERPDATGRSSLPQAELRFADTVGRASHHRVIRRIEITIAHFEHAALQTWACRVANLTLWLKCARASAGGRPIRVEGQADRASLWRPVIVVGSASWRMFRKSHGQTWQAPRFQVIAK